MEGLRGVHLTETLVGTLVGTGGEHLENVLILQGRETRVRI
jgi:hypothetical protein